MNNFIKGVIEETFASKAQQRFFYAKANEKGAPKKDKKKWSKWANEFSKKTDFDKIPEKMDEKDPEQVEMEFDEIVDKDGNIATGTKPANFNTKGVSDEWITDRVVRTAAGQQGAYNMTGVQNYRRYWGEADMSKNLGAEETIMKDKDYDEAYRYFTNELGLSDEETKERMGALGYEEKLPDDMVRLVENPKNFMEAYIESLLAKKKERDNDILSKETEEIKEVHPIIKRQINSLKNSMKSHGLTADDIKKHLEQDNE
jgi:hypothetical protein